MRLATSSAACRPRPQPDLRQQPRGRLHPWRSVGRAMSWKATSSAPMPRVAAPAIVNMACCSIMHPPTRSSDRARTATGSPAAASPISASSSGVRYPPTRPAASRNPVDDNPPPRQVREFSCSRAGRSDHARRPDARQDEGQVMIALISGPRSAPEGDFPRKIRNSGSRSWHLCFA